MELPRADLDRIARALGQRPVEVLSASEHFNHAARRCRVTRADGSIAFVKMAGLDYTAPWIRREIVVYQALDGAPFLPRYVGSDDDGTVPVLVLEDMTGARQPPPWQPGDIDALVAGIGAVGSGSIPPDTPSAEERVGEMLRSGWPGVAEDPATFLALGLASSEWLERNIDALLDASRAADIAGNAHVHCDIRSDNMFIRDGLALFVDWNHSCLGHPDLDLAAAVCALAMEGGPMPWQLLPRDHGISALISGYFAFHAGQPPIEIIPTLRDLQLAQLRFALPWVSRSLGLEPPT